MNPIAAISRSLLGLPADELARIARRLAEFMRTSGTGVSEVRERQFEEAPEQPLSVRHAESLRLEARSALRHEYVNGLV